MPLPYYSSTFFYRLNLSESDNLDEIKTPGPGPIPLDYLCILLLFWFKIRSNSVSIPIF